MRHAPAGEIFARDRALQPPALTPDYKTSVTRSPRLPPLSPRPTASELTGPVFGEADFGALDNDRLIAPLDMNASTPMDCLAYRFDIVLRGRRSTLFENRPEGN